MITWILQKNLTKPEVLTRIKSALNGEDETWEEVEIIPFSTEIPEISAHAGFKIIYGSTTFMLNAHTNEALREGVFFDPVKFQMRNYVDQWQDQVLNADGQLLKFGALKHLDGPLEKQWFIRPNTDGKAFSGKVASCQELQEWSAQVCALDLPELNEETEVWVSSPKLIQKEWRLFVVDDQIVAASRYVNNGELDESDQDVPAEMLSYAKERIGEYRIADIYVMDIALLEENNYKLIECNCFNGTGFYKHDIEEVIRSVNQYIKQKMTKKDLFSSDL